MTEYACIGALYRGQVCTRISQSHMIQQTDAHICKTRREEGCLMYIKTTARVSKEGRHRTHLLYPTNCLRRHIDSGVELFLVNEEHDGDEERIKFHFRGDLMAPLDQ